MKKLALILLVVFCVNTYAQKNTKISTIDFVQIVNDNKKEVVFYYQNNWELLRKMAIKKKYIDSYQLLKTSPTKDAPFSYMLITTYADQKQYDNREKNFEELIKKKGDLRLLNDKKPGEFRKIIFGKDPVIHLE